MEVWKWDVRGSDRRWEGFKRGLDGSRAKKKGRMEVRNRNLEGRRAQIEGGGRLSPEGRYRIVKLWYLLEKSLVIVIYT